MAAPTAIIAALLSALLFGASTPFAKMLTVDVSPVLLAGLLYLGSGLGLWTIRLLRYRRLAVPRLAPREWSWLLGAIALGGVIGPVLLMYGLTATSASSASLLLNLEVVMTVLIAWVAFGENASRRIVMGMVLIVGGGAALAWPQEAGGQGGTIQGGLLIGGACLCWALDNNLTRKVSAADADFIAGTKGLVAGITNVALATALGAHFPPPHLVLAAMTLGLLGYGASLVLFVLALRGLGTARTGAYFSTAPFLGAAIAVIALHDPAPALFWLSACLMAAGVALHLTESHSHEHRHEGEIHCHSHAHETHHLHEHDFAWDGSEPHVHWHRHDAIMHEHPHYPDMHHRHRH
ncbi:MAG: DMT family transporter [Steroidobacteraceae bacterium]